MTVRELTQKYNELVASAKREGVWPIKWIVGGMTAQTIEALKIVMALAESDPAYLDSPENREYCIHCGNSALFRAEIKHKNDCLYMRARELMELINARPNDADSSA